MDKFLLSAIPGRVQEPRACVESLAGVVTKTSRASETHSSHRNPCDSRIVLESAF